MEQTRKYINLSEHWEILNENVYNIENKFIALTTMLGMQIGDFSYHCRKINSKNKQNYNYRIACSLTFKNSLILRVYYEPEVNKILYKVFPRVGNLQGKIKKLNSEEELDDIITKCLESICQGDWAYQRYV